MIADAPWYIHNQIIQNDLKMPQSVIKSYSYNYPDRLTAHPNSLTHCLMDNSQNRRLERVTPEDLIEK